MNGITILETGFLSTIQDRGRWGYQSFGMPVSGPMDWYAFLAGNMLLGNPMSCAGIEIGAEGIVLRADSDSMAVLCGDGYDLFINRWRIPLWMVFSIQPGRRIKIRANKAGGWAYLIFTGGLQTVPVMGSRSTYLRGQIGGLKGQTLQAGDFIPLLPIQNIQRHVAGRRLLDEAIPNYAEHTQIEVVAGLHQDRFSDENLNRFFSQDYTITSDSDRMGYRLEGESLQHIESADIVSTGMVHGTIQVPGNGKPIVMMVDHPTAGGYTQIATVITADLPLLAQKTPGMGGVRFRQVNIQYAQQRYREQVARLQNGIKEDEDDNYRSEF